MSWGGAIITPPTPLILRGGKWEERTKYMAWKKISSKLIYKNKWMEVTEDFVRLESGKTLTYGVVRKRPFALIIPWSGKYLTLVGQHQYPINIFSWEFPQGHFEHKHKSIKETAREELREETGLRAAKIKKVASFYLAPGHHSQIGHIFLATGLAGGKPKFEESEEGMESKKVTLKQFQKMIKEGEIKDGPTLAAFGVITTLNLLN